MAMRLLATTLLLALLSGCAFIDQSTPVAYVAPPNLEVVQGASAVTISVAARDGRVSNKDRIGSIKNGYGMETARITAANDVVLLVRGAVENEIGSFGFKVGPGGLNVNVELQTFYNDFKPGFFSGDSIAEVGFNLAVTRADGSYVYSRSYKGIGMNKNIMMYMASNAKVALQEALTNAIQQLISDTALQQALVSATPSRTSGGSSVVPGM
jgi:uncharacterized lipoprotein YajG